MKEEYYDQLVNAICLPGVPSSWSIVFQLLPSLSLVERKAVTNLCRAQYIPDPNTRLDWLLKDKIPPHHFRLYQDFIDTPFSAGLLLSMIRCAPLPTNVIRKTFEDMVTKERVALETSPRPTDINFNIWFGAPSEPMSYLTPPNIPMSLYVQGAIRSWIEKEKTYLHYPKLSRKSIEETSAQQVVQICPYLNPKRLGRPVSQVELERVYHETGYQIEGPCEMRQKWYPAQLVPRTYYASGGTSFRYSKFLQKGLTDLCDSLPPTNRRNRVLPSRLTVPKNTHMVIYDLTSFTSNLHPLSEFVSRLAAECDGHMVRVVDAWKGVVEQDLGEMVREYNTLNVQHPCSLRKVLGKDFPEARQCTAGYLGVYGNIAISTFLHGATMLQICNNIDELNVAGDDGVVPETDDEKAYDVIRLLGLMAWEKAFVSHELGCICLKRPLVQIGQRLFQGSLVLWPSFELLPDDSNDLDPRYPWLSRMENRARSDGLASSITTFLTSLSTQPNLSDLNKEIAMSVITFLYRRKSLPLEGYVPQVQGNLHGFVSAVEKRYIGLEPKRNTIMRQYSTHATISKRIEERLEKNRDFQRGDDFECNSSACLVYCESLGYLTRTRISVVVVGEEGLNLLLKEYFSPDPPVFLYCVVKDLPQWLIDLL